MLEGGFGVNSSFMSIIFKCRHVPHHHTLCSLSSGFETTHETAGSWRLLGELSNCHYFSLEVTLCYCCMRKT